MLKASLEFLQSNSKRSFIRRTFGAEAFVAPYHFHPEYELTLITQGSGRRYVGNHMDYFVPGDLVLLGPNLPHCWKLQEAGTSPTGTIAAAAVVIQFSDQSLGTLLMEKEEFKDIRLLFAKAGRGVFFGTQTATLAAEAMHALAGKDDFSALIVLLQLLQLLSVSNEGRLLNQGPSAGAVSPANQQRLNPVFAYLVEHFRGQVSLEEAASIAHLSTNAFCRYFKKMTRKTFMEMVMEYRLNDATQQLIQSDKPISEISFESGFSDVSFFYRTFKKKMNISPLGYRRQFMKQV